MVAEQQRGQRAAPALPAGEAEHGPVERDPGEQLLDDLAGLLVGRPLVVLETTEHGLAHGVGVDQLVALVQVAHVQAAGHRDPPGVGLLEAGHHLQQRGLAVAVAAHDADPHALADAEGDLGQQRAHAVGLGDLLEVQQVRGGHQTYSTTCAPATGAGTTDVRRCPRSASSASTASAWCRSPHSSSTLGPEPESSAACAPAARASSKVASSSGRSRRAGSWRSLRSRRASCSTSPLSSASWRAVGDLGGRYVAPGVQLVEGAVDPGRGQAVVVRDHHPPPGAVVGDRGRPARRARCRPRCRRAARTGRRCPARRPGAAARRRGSAGPRAGRGRPGWPRRRRSHRPSRRPPGCPCGSPPWRPGRSRGGRPGRARRAGRCCRRRRAPRPGRCARRRAGAPTTRAGRRR